MCGVFIQNLPRKSMVKNSWERVNYFMAKIDKDSIQVGHTFITGSKQEVKVIRIIDEEFCIVQFVETGWKQAMLKVNCRNGYNMTDGNLKIVSQWQVMLNSKFGVHN